jgi:hypothetical protein
MSRAQTPTLIQHVSGSGTLRESVSSGGSYNIPLPNATLAGNALICSFQLDGTGPPALSVTDDKSNTWTLGASVTDTTHNTISAIYYALNVAPGTTVVHVNVTGHASDFVSAMVSEFNNVAAAGALDGSSRSFATGTSISSGSFTTSTPGDLIYQYASGDSGSGTSWSQGSAPWNLLSADYSGSQAAQYQVQASAGAINPTLAISPSTGWGSVAIALKSASAGTVLPAGIRVLRLVHFNTREETSGVVKFQFPTLSGNLIVMAFSSGAYYPTSMTDSKNNTYTYAGGVLTSDPCVKIFYAASASGDPALLVTANMTGNVPTGAGGTFFAYEIAGADPNPLDTGFGTAGFAGANGYQDEFLASGPVPTFTATPSGLNELVIVVGSMAADTATGWLSPNGAQQIPTTFTGELNPTNSDENNPAGLFYNGANKSAETWTFTHDTSNHPGVGAWAVGGAAFKDPPIGVTPPTTPTNLTATAVSSSQINLSWTASTDPAGITGYVIELCQGVGCTSFGRIATQVGTATTYSDMGLSASTSYSYRVKATDAAGNASGYSNVATTITPSGGSPPPPPAITSLNPASGVTGTSVTIAGTNFGAGPGTVTFAGTAAQPSSWSPTSIVVPVPAGASTGNVVVTAGGIASNGVSFTVIPSIKLVQHISKDAGTTTSATLAYPSNNTAGDWIAVCVRAGHSGQIFAITDSRGNTYHQAIQFNVTVDPPNGDTFGIFYAENIAGGANTITVQQSISGTMRFAILEYSGVATSNSLDGIAAQQGTSANPNSGNLTTTANGDLLLGAIMVGNPAIFTAGPGYTIEEWVPAPPNTKLIAEDLLQASAGQISASATLGASDSWGAGVAAFKMAGATPTPSAPSNLAATAVGPVEIDLSWTAATEAGGTIASYLIERCATSGCSNFVQVGTSPTTTFNDTSLLGSTSYSYRVRAKDSTGNTGPYSSTASATTAAPTFTAPSGLSATAAGPAQVNLSWAAATETGGTLANYLIERCSGACSSFTQVATIPSTTTAFSDTGLLGSTAYTYQVRATDGTNFSGYSNTSSATTAPPTFTAPASLAASAASNTQINLSWTAGTETGGTLTNYLIERCATSGCSNFAQVNTSTTTTFNDLGLTPSTSYSYRVRATDGTNFSGYSNTATATTPAATPTAPSGLTATAAGPVQVNLSWTAATESGGTIASYLIERCATSGCSNFAQVGTTTSPTTTFSDNTGLLGSTSYSYRVRAKDSTGTNGPYSNIASVTTAPPTFTAPSGLLATASGPAQVNLAWTAATETGGTLTNYLIERCIGATCSNFAQVGTSTTLAFNDIALLGSTTYSYRVRATDGTNFSGYSNTTSATTAAPTFTAPANLTATAAGNTQINLSWTAATETGGTISQYLIERCPGAACNNFTQVNSSTTTTFNDTGLTPATSYSYRVRATDAASNLGPYSNVASAATTSNPPPPITFIQVNAADPQTPQLSVTVPFTAAQRVGDLNVVVVGWNDSTATVTTVTDTLGNIYMQAVGPTVQTGTATQSIYYAKNIVAAGAGANSVTVKFNVAAVFPDIRILEYSGLDTTNPLDVSAGTSGTGATASSGAVTTTNANDLIIGADVVQTGTAGAGTGFTKRIITSPDSDLVEDRVVSTVGSYSATAPVSPSAPWIMQLVAFKAHP